jgi:caspase domain-containing protein
MVSKAGKGPILYNPPVRPFALAFAAFACAALAQPQASGPVKSQRLALVIGNAAYRDAPLPNAANDAADMTKALEASGFVVIRRDNATLKDMHLALREFGDKLGRQATGLVYFAGHGMQVRGRNYLVPVDADIAREDEAAFAALDLGAVMDKLDSAKNPVNIVILDACRNNPFGDRLKLSARGLAQVDAPSGTLIAFATAPGSTAADGAGRNGLYTQYLVRNIERPGIPIEEVFKAVRVGVRTDSRGQQIPWESTSLESAFMFRGAAPKPAPAPPRAATVQAKAAPVAAVRSAPLPLGSPPTFAPGDAWTYRTRNRLDNSERQGTVRVKEVRAGIVIFESGAVSDLTGNYIRTVRYDGRVDSYTPSLGSYAFPLNVGSGWSMDVEQRMGNANEERFFDVKVTGKVIGEEEIETPAGRMRALRIEREARWKRRGRANDAGVTKSTYWYSSAVKRNVAAETTNTTVDGKVLTNERVELVSYSVR